MTVTTSISLTGEQEAFARCLVEAGRYPSLSAVLRRGLEMLRRDSELRDAEIHALRLLIDQRRTGLFADLDEGEAETRAMLERKRKARAALWRPPCRRSHGRSESHRGSSRPELSGVRRRTRTRSRRGLRSVTDRRFIVYFEIDELPEEVTNLAVFFGGVDHRRQILDRSA